MQQILVVLSADADGPTISAAVGNSSGSLHSYLAPTVLLVDGGQDIQNALNQTPGVSVTLSDDAARNVLALTDITQLDIPGMATLIGDTLGMNTSFQEPLVLAIAGWMYGLSQQYAAKQSERTREGEVWNMEGGCLPTDDLNV